MGLDVPDIKLVINLDIPSQDWVLEQQTGRAGRDGGQAVAINLARRVRLPTQPGGRCFPN
jgi:superfamily II DNA helicase RecQ